MTTVKEACWGCDCGDTGIRICGCIHCDETNNPPKPKEKESTPEGLVVQTAETAEALSLSAEKAKEIGNKWKSLYDEDKLLREPYRVFGFPQ